MQGTSWWRMLLFIVPLNDDLHGPFLWHNCNAIPVLCYLVVFLLMMDDQKPKCNVGRWKSLEPFCAFSIYSFIMLIICPSYRHRSDMELNQSGSAKKAAKSASNKFRNSLSKRGRRSSKVMSIEIDDEIDAEEMQSVDAFRQALILEEKLPARHDDYHTLLR